MGSKVRLQNRGITPRLLRRCVTALQLGRSSLLYKSPLSSGVGIGRVDGRVYVCVSTPLFLFSCFGSVWRQRLVRCRRSKPKPKPHAAARAAPQRAAALDGGAPHEHRDRAARARPARPVMQLGTRNTEPWAPPRVRDPLRLLAFSHRDTPPRRTLRDSNTQALRGMTSHAARLQKK